MVLSSLTRLFSFQTVEIYLCSYASICCLLWKSCFIFPICRHQEQWFTVYCSKVWKLCFMWKNVEYPKMGIVYNFVKKYTRFIFFCEYFPFYLLKWFLQRPIVCFWSRTQKIKYLIFSKMQSIRFGAKKIIEML